MSRIDYVNYEMLKLMKKAGCHQIGYGVESANENILKNIKKFTDIETIKKIINFTKKAGITVRAMFVLGNPGETKQTLEDILNFCFEMEPDIVLFNIATPFPGTEMFNWAKNNGYLLCQKKSKCWKN